MLLLWDIDGTLLQRAALAHKDALFAALHDVLGITDPESLGVDTAGRTDGEIARLIALRAGVSAERIDAGARPLRAACCRHYARLCPDDLSAHVAPGVRELLERLAARDDVCLSLLTGNFEPVARLKLGRAGLGGFFALGQGAFGSDHESRAELPAVARARAGDGEGPWPAERTVVIGDTPRDIACARADGVHCLAVATGPYPLEALGDADAAVADARALAPVLEELLDRVGRAG